MPPRREAANCDHRRALSCGCVTTRRNRPLLRVGTGRRVEVADSGAPAGNGGGVSRYRSGNSCDASPRLRPSPGLCTSGSRLGVPVALGGVEPVASVEFGTDAAGVFVVFTSVAHDQPNAAPRAEHRARMGSRRPCNTLRAFILVCPVLLTSRCLGPPATDTSDRDRESGPFRAPRRTAPNAMPQNAGTPRRWRIRAMRAPGRASRVQRCARLTRRPSARACPAGTAGASSSHGLSHKPTVRTPRTIGP